MNNQQFAVMGSPIEHSLSPIIHQLFAQQHNLPITYAKMKVEPADCQREISQFFANGGRGLNLTSPLKQVAYQYMDDVTINAKQVQAINTVFLRGNQLVGDNTDTVGFAIAYDNLLKLPLNKVLLLGAGGVASAILPVLTDKAQQVIIVSRDTTKASFLAKPYRNVVVTDYANMPLLKYTMVINATSLTGEQALLPRKLNSNYYVDLQYTKASWMYNYCKLRGLHYINGIAMLVEQAGVAFTLWHQLPVATHQVYQELKEKICN